MQRRFNIKKWNACQSAVATLIRRCWQEKPTHKEVQTWYEAIRAMPEYASLPSGSVQQLQGMRNGLIESVSCHTEWCHMWTEIIPEEMLVQSRHHDLVVGTYVSVSEWRERNLPYSSNMTSAFVWKGTQRVWM
jgi:hypothetical protein